MSVGEVFLSVFLQVLFDRLAPHDWSFFPRPNLVPELQRWKRNLLKIEAVLADAEEKQLTGDKLVKMWLDYLQDLAYDLDDLLDEFSTQELERKLMAAEHQSTTILEDACRVFGHGKTTLAQKVFNDEAVKDFNPKAWTCVSEDFDVLRISKAILESITRSPCDLKELDAVQKEL
ncbi:hypothetical protein Ddye_028416 [Dipteronia dyeriana]|uniref:Rx N-terminal domain-containing protein n=1 Tax=Dipteronia dyeriana TaxID=168575 RepID=A0AAD9WRD5_9ROSI|nr:hypothetical protein Ddye_028416 [Dipteronia dyeriana]